MEVIGKGFILISFGYNSPRLASFDFRMPRCHLKVISFSKIYCMPRGLAPR